MQKMVVMVTVMMLLASASACKKDLAVSSPIGAGTPPPEEAIAESNALWALAPEDAHGGVVISQRGLALLEGAVGAVQKMLELPEMAEAKPEVEAYLRGMLGTTELTRAALGLGADRGAAVFLVQGGVIAILPVANRTQFVQRMGGTPGGAQDRIGALACRPVGDRYACASDDALLGRIGGGSRLSAGQAGARGDIEAVGDVPTVPGIRVAVAAQLERGAVTLRGAFTNPGGTAAQRLAVFDGPPVQPRVDPDRTAGFFVAHLGAFAVQAAHVLARDPSLEAVARSLEGPLSVTVPTGPLGLDAQQGLSAPEPMSSLIRSCPDSIMIDRGPSLQDGICRLWFGDVAAEPVVTGKTLRVRTSQAEGPRVPMSRLGAELAAGAWEFAGWARGVFDMRSLSALARDPDRNVGAAVVRLYMMINEVGGGFRADGQALRFMLGVRTAYANPDEIVAALAAIPPRALLDGTADGRVREIAGGAPGSPFAADHAAGAGGLLVLARLMNAFTAVAIPTFMDAGRRGRGD